jgi:electron transfer flavoprotein beta subunit
MNILVSVKRVPDYEIKVKVNASGDGIVTDGIKWVLNPFDEIAVEEALQIRDRLKTGKVSVVTIGPKDAAEQLRKALAMGADHGIHIVTDKFVDSALAAELLTALYRKSSFDLVIMGKQSVDSDANQTGQLLAAALDLPQGTFASKVEILDGAKKLNVTREVDGGLETICITAPAVLTTDLRLNTPRYVPLPGIVKARKMQLEEYSPESLGVSSAAALRVVKLSLPPARKGGGKVSSVSELVEKLRGEAKVI